MIRICVYCFFNVVSFHQFYLMSERYSLNKHTYIQGIIMQHWQHLLIKGNDFYHKKHWIEAEEHYREAEEVLNTSWNLDRNDEGLLMAWICATHNLAALYERQNEHAVSLQYLLLAHKRVLKLAQIGQPDNVLKLIAIKALKITLTPIILFKKKHPICEDCMTALMDVKTIKVPELTAPVQALHNDQIFTVPKELTMH
jgi:hypothetical protein